MSQKDIGEGVQALRPAPRRNHSPWGYIPDLPPESARLAELLGASRQATRYGEHLALRRWFSEPDSFAPHLDSLRLLAPQAPPEALDPRQWIFLDTETTGLAGGTGTYAFLVGLAWWDAGGLEVEQFFMRDHSEEHSVLVALRERLIERPVLVTFNGKSFDWPLLETRFRMTRSIALRAPAAHLDLLHPARQLWRLRLGSARLAHLEKHILGWERGADVPSELIPQIYFDFLRGGPAEPLLPVFRHNQMDLRGLALLAERIFSLLSSPESAVSDSLELYGLSRLFRRRGNAARARELCGRSLAAGLPEEFACAARRELARMAKREHDYDLANSLWETLRQKNSEGAAEALEASVELAIHYERRARQPQRAAEITRSALAQLAGGFRAGRIPAARYRRLQASLEHRLERLSRKAHRFRLLAPPIPESPAAPGLSNKEA